MRKRNYRYIFFWVFFVSLLYFSFELPAEDEIVIVYLISFVVFQFLAFFINLNLFLPKLYNAKHYYMFGFVNLLFVAFIALLSTYIETTKDFSNYIHTFDIEEIFAHAVPSILAIFLAFLLHNYDRDKIQEQKILEVLKAEKDFLIQQINPHFLFNTLNNIYSLTLENNPKSSEAILQLSKLLDYSLYGNKNEWVTLESEINYINNFIKLFRLKDDYITKISFDSSNADLKVKIAPLLLLPFVENAFKHSNIEDINNGFISISITTNKDFITFYCNNSFVSYKKTDKTGGIGIANVTRRLELIYPEAHNLKIKSENGLFEVMLKLKLK